MVEELYDFLQAYEQYAILISITVSIVVAILGVIPTFFVTAANLLFFGVWKGALISFAGEALGAIVAFYLYRKGFRNMSQRKLDAYPRAKAVINTQGREAFVLILALRLMPFMPSVIVTFSGAISKISFVLFAVASTLGKIPALAIEVYSVYHVTQFSWQGIVILMLSSVYLLYWLRRRRKKPL